jgi:hypothetical protein
MPCPSYPCWYNRPKILVRNTPYDARNCALSSISILRRTSYAQISSSTPCSQTPSFNTSDQVSHTRIKTGTIIILCILTFIFWVGNGRQEDLDRKITGISWVDSALYFFMNEVLICYGCPQTRECCHFLPVFSLWFCTASWPRDINMYSISSASLLDHCPC